MREMKKTTIPFCEYIPDKWQVLQNRYLFCNHSVKVGENYNEYQLLSLTTSGVKKKDINASGGKVPTSYYNYQTVSNGDMIFCLFDLDCSAVFSGLSSFEGMITSAYDVFKPEEKYVDKHYIEYWFQYVFSYRYYKMYSKSIRYTITSDMFKAITTPVPPIEEQRRIGEYLDSKCTQIDALISNAQQQIEKLKAYKQSVITETVTKGLDPDVTMKDSGVEWIGEIPEDWEVTKFGRICKVKSNLVHPENYPDYIQIAPDNIEKGSGKLLPCQTVKESGVISDNHLFYKGQIIYSKIRPILNKVTIAPFDGLCSADMYPIETTQNYRYVLYYMLSNLFLIQVKMVTENRVKMPKINQEEISQIMTVFPSVEGQNEIVTFLDKKCTQIDSLIAIKQQKIEKLQKYKKSLIYEYVTGKKEV